MEAPQSDCNKNGFFSVKLAVQVNVKADLYVCVFFLLTTGAAQEWGEQNFCHEDPEEAAHSGHETAGAHSFWETHHAGGTLGLYCEVRSQHSFTETQYNSLQQSSLCMPHTSGGLILHYLSKEVMVASGACRFFVILIKVFSVFFKNQWFFPPKLNWLVLGATILVSKGV